MNRKEFLHQSILGLGVLTIGASIAQCLAGCTSSPTAPTNVDFTLDLTQPVNAPLKTVGGFVRSNGVTVACIAASTYVAVQSACTHEGTNVNWEQSASRFHCPNHDATFTKDGVVTRGPASTNLATYKVTQTGTLLRVTS